VNFDNLISCSIVSLVVADLYAVLQWVALVPTDFTLDFGEKVLVNCLVLVDSVCGHWLT
jgi:hypothetical protein